ncbi:hypothetical protein LTR78_009105 [Recurvomyces mirabilis]|uniref:Amino acid transporter n=1 Tax=Recurvomyces mirabilis TaxID=574656 RepID=A0AAE0WGN2_9PEZI|nr:hypothetical protein LTR78_009105 [Recurvomyces mirabilis]KAK5161043.1 hypothetical protein LTS14_000837 [Recurvomyces mirabilis]
MGLPLNNGGPAGMLWMTILAAIGIFMCDLSLAEMASMSPSSAGPYQWTAELAPLSMQKVLSFVVGYYDVLGWQAALAFSAFLIASNIQGLLFLFRPSYVPHSWHITLLMIASALVTIIVNYRSTRILRHASWLMGVLFIALWLYICITLAVMAPHPNTRALTSSIALDFQDPSGWGSNFAVLVGILGPISTFVGGDVSCHMSEETKDASVSVPRAIYRSAAIGYTMTILTTILIIYSLGPDISAILSSPSGQPYQQVLYNATKREDMTVIMVTFMLLLIFFSQVTTTTASSRQMFTFARDGGLPLHSFLSKVTTTTHIPRNSVFVTFIIVSLLSLIPLGSVIAFNIITSLSSIAIFSSYWISIACRLSNRFSVNRIAEPRWNLGVAGIAVNIFALLFLTLGIIMICFPSAPNPNPTSFNWTVVIWGGVSIFALIYYFAYGRRHYASPRSRVTQFGQEGDLDMQEFESEQMRKEGDVRIMADEP